MAHKKTLLLSLLSFVYFCQSDAMQVHNKPWSQTFKIDNNKINIHLFANGDATYTTEERRKMCAYWEKYLQNELFQGDDQKLEIHLETHYKSEHNVNLYANDLLSAKELLSAYEKAEIDPFDQANISYNAKKKALTAYGILVGAPLAAFLVSFGVHMTAVFSIKNVSSKKIAALLAHMGVGLCLIMFCCANGVLYSVVSIPRWRRGQKKKLTRHALQRLAFGFKKVKNEL